MALERVRGKRTGRSFKQFRFLKGLAKSGASLFSLPSGDPFGNVRKLAPVAGPIIGRADDLLKEINTELANAGIDLSRKMIAFSDAITDLAQEVSPIDKRVEKVLDGILDFPTEAYFKAWIFTLEFYLDSVEDAKDARENKMKVLPKTPVLPPSDKPSRQPKPRDA